MQMHDDIVYLDHFASFLKRCHFSKDFAATAADTATIIGQYPLLQHIAIAIGALDASRKGSTRAFGKLGSAQQTAFRAYGRSIQDLHTAISTAGPVFRDDVFWSTFFHGLFELLAENTGNSFVNHMVYGTSKMLFMLKPTIPFPLATKSLIDAFWILEINRAILYGDIAILPDNPQRLHMPRGKSILLAGLINDTKYHRLFDTIEGVPEELRSIDPTLDALALEGLEIKERLLTWQGECHFEASETSPVDSFTQLSVTVHRALHLYHCNNFTFYSCWMTRLIPRLNRSEVNQHVSEILDLSERLLSDTHIPAVLLLFPLRMAGVHVSGFHGQDKVLGAVRKIRQQGFVVSDTIEVDLKEFWQYRLGQPIEINEVQL
ncbi:unnamed protein product [Penicillium olsonii]|nr:unnamed protein product [Penicillium olsonii]CAG7928192.1 unnamed protein product [Penicillium olsonii]